MSHTYKYVSCRAAYGWTSMQALNPDLNIDLFSLRYPRPSVTVDACIVAQPNGAGQSAKLLLIKRKNEPFQVMHQERGKR